MFCRHDLAWLSADGWEACAAQLAPAGRAAVDLWRREGWPAVVRRGDVGADDGIVSLGIALPPGSGGNKQRIALRAQAAHVVRHLPPLALDEAMRAAPQAWQPKLAALSEAAPGLRAYGSLSFQALTGRAYMTASSDIDLLAFPRSRAGLAAAISVLAEHAERLPLDGEIVFPNGDAVAWKEWRNAGLNRARVLAKSIAAVRLADTGELAALLEDV